MKLKQETINAIKTEVEALKEYFFNTHTTKSVEQMFHQLVADYQLRGDALEEALSDPDFVYFDIHTDHTITTMYLNEGMGWVLGTVEVYEGDGSCGIWEYHQILNNEVEFNG